MNRTVKTFLTVLAIAAAFLVFTRLFGDTTVGIAFDDDDMTLTAPRQFSVTVAYDDIQSLELAEDFAPGTPVTGDESRRCAWGEWECAGRGRCTLCVSKKIDCAVVIHCTDGGQVLFNYESADTTRAIHQMLLDMLADRAGG